jgi:hypothetical protein
MLVRQRSVRTGWKGGGGERLKDEGANGTPDMLDGRKRVGYVGSKSKRG